MLTASKRAVFPPLVCRSLCNFGLLFDIDGVIVRGREVLPGARDAFRKLTDHKGTFRVPTVFVTNAGNSLRQAKAHQLTKWLGINISEDQVVMSHSPLRMYSDFHDKHVLVTGQGPVRDIAHNLGFKNVTTISEMRFAFPKLDCVDHKRRRAAPCSFDQYFPKIESIVMFGEPTRWETSLQLLLDVLLSDGLPCENPVSYPYPHLPILACNMDLQWMAEAVMPRFGHGAFLVSLENLYKKVTGFELVYTALIGKPSEITYRHSEHVLQEHARSIGIESPVKHLYCIGDNVCTDIFGSNLYDRYLRDNEDLKETTSSTLMRLSRRIDRLVGVKELSGAIRCFSILVETGVYSGKKNGGGTLMHSPRDFLPVEDCYQEPHFVARNVNKAVDLIFQEEGFS